MRTVIAARTLRKVASIDAGDTVVIELEEAAAGQTLSLLIPTREIAALTDGLTAVVIDAAGKQAARDRNSG